jgi:signal-transduction protein with cAMP-binding, CBS, and nucleotidyltransferase domain
MNKNELFRRFIENPLIKEKIEITDDQIHQLDLHSHSSIRLVEVIKTTILHLDKDQSVDSVARRINLTFKKDIL